MDNSTTKNNIADSTTDNTFFCTKCGFRMNEQFDFCPKCGTKAAVISSEKASNDQEIMNEQPGKTTKKEKITKKRLLYRWQLFLRQFARLQFFVYVILYEILKFRIICT